MHVRGQIVVQLVSDRVPAARPGAGGNTGDIAVAIRHRREQPDISARSVLVTVLGDSVLPVTKTVWLSSLFELARPFGFSERLVRTSMFRLAAEGWVSNERVGRRSRYSLTRLCPWPSPRYCARRTA